MSSPQTEDGYTRIANELLDAILRYPFSKRELNIVLAVIRKTYGYNKKSDDMTLTQLADLARLDLAHVSRTVSSLTQQNVLLKQQGKYGYVLGINKKYNNWTPCQNSNLAKTAISPCQNSNLAKTAISPCQNSNIALPKQQYRLAKTANTKDNSKRQYQKTIPKAREAAPGLDIAAWEKWVEYRAEIRKPIKPVSEELAQKALAKFGGDQSAVVEQSIANSWQGLFPVKSGDNKKSHDPFAGAI